MCCVMGYTGHDLSAAKFKEYLLRTVMRGPDDQRVVEGPFGLMGFGRLAIMGLTPEGMQPFYRGADCVVCNGELYGFRFEKEILKRRGYKFASDCDCEILLPLYYEYGLDMFRHMDSEFALILYDSRKDRLIAARDPIGIRPLFYGYSKSSHQIAFASEMQNLIGWCDDIRPFPIGSYYCDGRFVRYEDIADVPAPMEDDMETTLRNIREKLIAGVEKRLDADAPVGFLLSGGLDSSVLLYAVSQLKGKSYGEITAVHVHHGLSKHANEWAEFCAERARKYGVNFVLRKVTVPSGGAGFEAEARQLRYAVLEEEAKKAQESARALFTGGNAAEMPTSELTEADFVDGKIDILGVLVKSGLSASRSEARRAVEQGGVVVADEKVTDVKTAYDPEQFDGEGLVVRRGKKNFKRVVMSK